MTEFDFSQIKTASKKRMAVRVSPAGERAVRSGHPWIYTNSIQRQNREGMPGDLAVIFDRKNRFLAIGLYDPGSEIRIRILQRNVSQPIDEAWFSRRINDAAMIRRPLLDTKTNAYRLVHGENDGLPGLIIDRYAEYYVVKIYSTAWIPHLRHVLAGINTQDGVKGCILRLSDMVRKSLPPDGLIFDGLILDGSPPSSAVSFLENGLQFQADIFQGQKTGFFLDQRENRAIVETLAQGKYVLNVFSYTGGFSIYAARGGAKSVDSLDLSRPALDWVQRHFELNDHFPDVKAATHAVFQGDAYQILDDFNKQGRKYDLIILDPPSFARRKASIARALAAYRRLNQLGIRLLQSGGMLVSASCSSRIGADAFFEVVGEAAVNERRSLSIIQKTGQPLDHPVGFSEGAYLKCVFARVR